ncbi:hypothetical protein BH11PLA2_BH11PLA2_01390 [soil metagenome]
MYLTLVMGSVTLGYSEFDYLPEVTAFTGVVIVMMLIAFRMDQRGRHLTLDQANTMGLVIFLITVAWIGYHYRDPDSLMHTLPWPAGGLPYLGPLLMILVPAKLFRPKHIGDWWGLQAMSLCGVGLAVSLAEDLVCVLLVLLYAVSAVWSLTLFYLFRAAGKITPYPTQLSSSWQAYLQPAYWFPLLHPRHDSTTLAAAFEGIGPPSPAEQLGRSHFVRSLRWLAMALLLASPFFFLMPRNSVQWELFQARSRMETGFSSDGIPDLGRVGQLHPSKEVAFEVLVLNNTGQPVDDLPPDQRWRGAGYVEYQSPRGRWVKGATSNSNIFKVAADQLVWRPTENLEFPNFGPDTLHMDFRIVGKPGGPLFADPVAFNAGERPPAAIPFRAGFNYAVQIWDASFVLLPGRDSRIINRYLQVTRGRDGKGRILPSTFELVSADETSLLAPFLTPPPRPIQDFAHKVLDQLFASGTLDSRIKQRQNPFTKVPRVEDHAAVAAAFNHYFSGMGQFGYTLDLRRQNKDIDPIEDFLLNVRNGHCERFATALVLMLRGVGIPAQYASGYRGLEPQGNGRYFVRQADAHAWAEVLLMQSTPQGPRWYWQAYDPTPGVSSPLDDANANLIDSGTRQGKRLLTDYLVGLNADTQQRLHEGIGEFLENSWPWLLGGVLVFGVAILAIRKWSRNHRDIVEPETTADPATAQWYSTWLQQLAVLGWGREVAETPFEHARRMQERFRAVVEVQLLADVPLSVAALLDSVRYADVPLTPESMANLEPKMAAFLAAIRGSLAA